MSIVVLVMIDGARPDALDLANCPNLTLLRTKGAYTLKATSVMPSVTLPCHMSIFHSVPPTRHGITTNDWVPMARPIPGLVEQAHAASLQAAFFYGWEPLRNISLPDKLTLSYCCNLSATDLESDPVLIDETIRFMAKYPQLDFAFVYLGTVDSAGHKYGWMSDGYLAQLEQVDGALGKLLDALPDGATVLVQSDHGGHDRSHGTDSPEDMTIPWLISGPGIRPGYEISTPVSLLDTVPTLARLLNIRPHPAWEGRCIEEVFIKH